LDKTARRIVPIHPTYAGFECPDAFVVGYGLDFSERYLPIWIGSVEATAIALEQQGVRPARPLTHDLLKDVIGALGRNLEQVRITDLQEGTFFAELVFDGDVRVSARPSDSVALALRVGVPIHAEESVLAEAGLIIPDEQEDEVEKFREFLDSVSPEDFRGADT
jgi:bifunctional DNase/RNase